MKRVETGRNGKTERQKHQKFKKKNLDDTEWNRKKQEETERNSKKQ